MALNLLAVAALLLSYTSSWISPETAWPLALLGLAYPVLLLVNLLFLFLWLILRRKQALWSLGAILLGLSQFFSVVQFTGGDGTVKEDAIAIKVLSYNVRLFDLYEWTAASNTKDSIFDLVASANADIVCFQEFYDRPGSELFATRDSLKQLLNAKHISEAYTQKLSGDQRFGIATYSAYPIANEGVIKFGESANNICLWSDVVIGKKDTIRVYNAHLASIRFQREDYKFMGELSQENVAKKESWSSSKDILKRLRDAFIKRASQAEQLAEHVAQSPHPIILAGDFNDTPLSYSYAQLANYLSDAFVESGHGVGNSYVGIFPSFRIDYIMYNEPFQSADFEVDKKDFSDHYPISATLAFPRNSD